MTTASAITKLGEGEFWCVWKPGEPRLVGSTDISEAVQFAVRMGHFVTWDEMKSAGWRLGKCKVAEPVPVPPLTPSP